MFAWERKQTENEHHGRHRVSVKLVNSIYFYEYSSESSTKDCLPPGEELA